jgi:hypothetical protein
MHPEHFDLAAPVFLPVTAQTCARLLESDGAQALANLSDPELAAVLVVQNLAQASEQELTSAATEKVLARLLGWAVDGRHSANVGLASEARRLFDPRKLYFGLNAAQSLNLRFLLPDEVSAREYLLADGKWDVDFKFRHQRLHHPFSEPVVTPRHRERWLSAAQDKLVRTFRANLDEDLHVQGYAGIGKSHLLGVLVECLRADRTLLLARTADKLQTLRQRLKGSHDQRQRMGATFEGFAKALLRGPRPMPEGRATRQPAREAVAQELNIFGFQSRGGQATLELCLKVLEAYCHSRDHSLSSRHLPHFKVPLSPVETQVLLEYSTRVWRYLEANPGWGEQTGFKALWMLKCAALAGCEIPARYTHVLIDESQDIAPCLLQIIERGKQVLVTLGDEYQHASDDPVRRKREVRQADISYSVRSGRNIERLLNPLIYRHTKKIKIPFEGARDADVGIEQYPEGFVPPQGCVILAASLWDMMKWAIEMSDANCPFSIVQAPGRPSLEAFMNCAVALFRPDLYSREHIEVLHDHFSDLADWQQVRELNGFDEAFLWVQARLERGFNRAEVTRLNRLASVPGERCLLMLAQDAGGMEFDQVLLTTELLTNVRFKDAYAFDERLCEVYIAISRARRKLFVPYDVVSWVEFHDYQKFRDTPGF